tara:strand:- start:1582 stop:2442 length:861 start_codon:yes stop_codon:yes gene_type:complete
MNNNVGDDSKTVTSNKENLLSVENLYFNWGDNQVLKNINFSIFKNELVAVLGVNGAGKSTMLKCINKILNPESGNIKLLDKNIKDFDLIELAKNISYVPQSVLTQFSMDVFDVVLLGRRPHINWRISEKDRDFVTETLRFLDLEDFAFRSFNKLSGGERQRVIIAKAIAQDPKLLIMDEPTSDLDLKNQIVVMKNIKKLISKDDYKSAIIAIHDINIAARFADRILLLHENGVIAEGTPEEVLNSKNIGTVFGVSCEIQKSTKNEPMRIIIKDDIKQNNKNENEEE